MDLKTIQNELQKLSELISGWASSQEISSLERDLALEKLRALYDALRFSVAEPAANEIFAERIPAENFDLGEVLSLNLESEESEESENSEGESQLIAPSAQPQVSEPMPAIEPEPESAPEPVFEPAPESASVAEPAPASEPESDDESASAAPARLATLFGLEEEGGRDRRKQRMIMSLYGTPSPAPQEPVATPKPTPAPTPVEVPEAQPAAWVELEPVAAAEPAKSDLGAIEVVATFVDETDQSDTFDEPEVSQEEFTPPAGAVLGDVMNHNVQTLGDTLASPRMGASEFRRSEPITDLSRAIGINDKFLMIRDLFGGDGVAYEEAIGDLNGQPSLDDCMIYIAENYAWNPNSDGAKLIMELLERKFV